MLIHCFCRPLISGTASVPVGSTTLLTDAAPGGVWTSGSPSIATIGAGTGLVTGVSPGNSLISYTVTNSCGSARALYTVTVTGGSSSSITGATSLCTGVSSTLSDTASGGYWLSGAPAVATIGSTTGVVNPIMPGIATISYMIGSSVSATVVVTVNATPTITGTTSVCGGTTTMLTGSPSGGVWMSSSANATVNSTSGLVTGVTGGTSTIYYTAPTGCSWSITMSVISLSAVVINPSSATICAGGSVMLTSSGGTVWSPGTGLFSNAGLTSFYTGIAADTVYAAPTSTMTYAATISASGCSSANNVTVTVNPLPGAIAGSTTICAGSTTPLSNSVSGGTWSTSNAGIASIDGSGNVTGVAAGTCIISYGLSSGCAQTAVMTILATPSSISGPSSVCVGQTITLSTSSTGGSWYSSAPTQADVNMSTGVVTGLASGFTVTISYSYGTGCSATYPVVVNSLAPITGPTSVCTGQTVTLSDAVSGGSWICSDATATVGLTTGVVTGISTGSATISYFMGGTGCTSTFIMAINGSTPITGPSTVCVGQTVALSTSTPGGTWSSSAPSIASVGSTGLVSGLAGGLTAIISYSTGAGCVVTYAMTVNTLSAITGPTSVCQGQTITLTDAAPGGTWTSASANVSVGASTGVITGISGGTASITYTVASGCSTSTIIAINPISPIAGPSSVCQGLTITLTDATPGGTWYSASPTIATIGSTGIVTGIASGLSATISYYMASGCTVTTVVSVSAFSAITGTSGICQGSSTTFYHATPGGVWSSPNATVSVGSASGLVTALSAGTATISYTTPAGCVATSPLVIYPSATISGSTLVCRGQSVTLTASVAGGSWSTGAPTIATVGSGTGVVNGISSGTGTSLTTSIYYTLTSGCSAFTTVTVYALSPITGLTNVCPGLTITLSDLTPGGVWISSAPGAATIGSTTGLVTGVAAGTTIISYLMPSGCLSTYSVNAGGLAPITGSSVVCVGQITPLSDATPGGTWSSSAPTIATVGSTGNVTGMAGNLTANITYALSSTCRSVKTVSVYPISPISISGTIPLCVGTTTTATDPLSGGIWSSSALGIATVGTTGVITGIASGTAQISYSMPTGCNALATVSVNPLSPIVGASNVCWHLTTTWTNATPGGTWYSPSSTIATVGSTGIVTGLANNLTAIISYNMPSGCRATKVVSVSPLPAAPATIGGPSTVSISGATITLTNATAGGTWSSSNVAKATVVAGTGVVTGVGVGSATITYTVSNSAGCTNISTKAITVGPMAAPHTTTTNTTLSMYTGTTVALTAAKEGGVWSIADGGDIVSVNWETGLISAQAPGRAKVYYTVVNDNSTSIEITEVIVNIMPEAVGTTMSAIGYLSLTPNPNKGEFTVKGLLTNVGKGNVSFEITDMLGQVVYKGNTNTADGKISEHIILSNSLANGNYILNVNTDSGKQTIHFVLDK